MTREQSREIDKRVLALLTDDSTQKPAALAKLTETSAASMNARLNRLVREGKLKKRKRGRAIRYQVPSAAAETTAWGECERARPHC
jgi:DNA-binding Lrp family transcriptional regulator